LPNGTPQVSVGGCLAGVRMAKSKHKAHYLSDNLKMCARLKRFDGGHDEPLRADSGFFLGMLHGGVLIPDGSLRPDAKTLVIIHTEELSGRVFPLTQQEQPRKHPVPFVRRATVLQEG
jgi:hypothetical protein